MLPRLCLPTLPSSASHSSVAAWATTPALLAVEGGARPAQVRGALAADRRRDGSPLSAGLSPAAIRAAGRWASDVYILYTRCNMHSAVQLASVTSQPLTGRPRAT
eukprot:jgi/Chrpa1/26936/Chrysochromulina_OHIO_Genome00026513-RA